MILESLLELLEPLPESKNLVRTESLFSNNLRSMLLAVLRRRLLSFVKKQKKTTTKINNVEKVGIRFLVTMTLT